jgi:hypothetical protein
MAPPPRAASPKARPAQTKHRDWVLWVGTVAFVGFAWLASRYGGFTPGSDLGYWLGVVGGVAMVFTLLYPMRKRMRAMHSLGRIKPWFLTHMILGVGGPFLVLTHSTFHIGSINAGVALISMLLVAASGVIGRFIYVRIHHGLYGQRATLKELQEQAGMNEEAASSIFANAPQIEARLHAFHKRAIEDAKVPLRAAWSLLTLGTRGRWIYWQCRRELAHVFHDRGAKLGWDRAKRRRRLRKTNEMVRAYILSVQRVTQFHVYERLFSLWHVLHLPLVWLLAFSAIVHVIAVHAY